MALALFRKQKKTIHRTGIPVYNVYNGYILVVSQCELNSHRESAHNTQRWLNAQVVCSWCDVMWCVRIVWYVSRANTRELQVENARCEETDCIQCGIYGREYDFVFACVLLLYFHSKMYNKQTKLSFSTATAAAAAEAVKHCETAYISHNLHKRLRSSLLLLLLCSKWLLFAAAVVVVCKNCIEPY